jgi:hypothetical protein
MKTGISTLREDKRPEANEVQSWRIVKAFRSE